jgi:putative ABC transport system ATP-binding protein/lipoprotein-releasing system ATP-binding protein
MNSKEIHSFRNRNMGFIFQFHYLLPEFTSLENVLMPARKAGILKEKRKFAEELFEKFDLKEKMHEPPGRLSGGQQQRVAIVRSMIMNPAYIFADEPTGSLDSSNGRKVMEIFKTINPVRYNITPDRICIEGKKTTLSSGYFYHFFSSFTRS